jgi:hypothetical protein
MMDRNLWATTNDVSKTWSYGYKYQWWNNYWFKDGCWIATWCSDDITSWSLELMTNWVEWENIYNNSGYYWNIFIKWGLNGYWSDWKTHNQLWWWWNDGRLNNWWYPVINPEDRQWPCPEWYHVPTYDELRGMLWAFYYYYRWIWDDPNNHSFEDEVLIPYAGSRDFEYWWSWWQWEHRWLWSSTPSRNWNLAHSQALYSSHSENDLSRGAWFSLRCFKD